MCLACEMADWTEMEAAEAAAAKRKGRKAKPAKADLFICEMPVGDKQPRRAAAKPRPRATRVKVSAGRD